MRLAELIPAMSTVSRGSRSYSRKSYSRKSRSYSYGGKKRKMRKGYKH